MRKNDKEILELLLANHIDTQVYGLGYVKNIGFFALALALWVTWLLFQKFIVLQKNAQADGFGAITQSEIWSRINENPNEWT